LIVPARASKDIDRAIGGNVTVDPRHRTTPADDPAITEAPSLQTGRLLDAKRLIRSFHYDGAIRLRSALKDAAGRGRPRLV
jgi:hypothetical protein